MKKQRSNLLIVIVGIIAVILAVAALFVFLVNQNGKSVTRKVNAVRNEVSESTEEKDENYENITYNGSKYIYNKDLRTILFLGVDQTGEAVAGSYKGNGGRSDVMVLLIIDEKDKIIRPLAISRDTMVDVDMYDQDGSYLTTANMQIDMQYSFGEGTQKSSWLAKRKVSELLHDIPIDSYVSLNMDGINALVDILGGVNITFADDQTEIDPSYIKGSTVKMDAKEAEHYVRYRNTKVTGSNDKRMEHQNQFFRQYIEQLKAYIGSDADKLNKFFDAADPYMVSNVDVSDLKSLITYKLSEEDYKVPGNTKEGKKHDEYYVDDDKLMDLIVDLLYIKQ